MHICITIRVGFNGQLSSRFTISLTNFQVKMLVGGEESKNEKIKQRKNERKKHADKKRDELKMLVEQDVSKAVYFARADACRCSDSLHCFDALIRCFDSVL